MLFVVYGRVILLYVLLFVFKQKTAYEMRISDWSSDVCSSDLSGRMRVLYQGFPRSAALGAYGHRARRRLDRRRTRLRRAPGDLRSLSERDGRPSEDRKSVG